MELEDEIREKMKKYDLVLVYDDNWITRLLIFILKVFFPSLKYNPLAPIFGYNGEIYGIDKDRNLAEILVNGGYKTAYVISSKIKSNRRRRKDLLRVLREYKVMWVVVKYFSTGIAGVLINMVFFVILFKILKIPDLISLVSAIEISIIITFLMNNYWVFSNRVYTRSIWWRMGAYHFTLIMGIFINVGTYWVLNCLGINYIIADFVGIVFASLWNFYITNAHVFFSKYQKIK